MPRAIHRAAAARGARLEHHRSFTAILWAILLAALHAPGAGAGPQQRLAAPDGVGREKIHYDYVENGALSGGFILVEPGNPLHTALGPEASANLPFVTLVENGPSANRIDVTFVGDGYQGADLATYAAHVQSFFDVFFSEPPLSSYAPFFNVYRVDVTSTDSGVDHDPTYPTWRSTALDMGFFCSGIERLLCVNVSKAQNAAASAPGRDLVVAVANSTKYGGAGYNDLATFAGGNGSAFEVALHEIGHSLPGLADEYHYGDGATYTGGEPSEKNVSIYAEAAMLAQQRKWWRWLDLPNVATYEGARYYQYGIYRPTSNSKMRSLGRPFEEVNTEQFILEFYRHVRPIDAATAAGTYFGEQTVLSIVPVHPASHALTIEWFRDGAPIPGAAANDLAVQSLGLAPGLYQIGVAVTDETAMVRNETARQSLMHEEREWTVVVPEFALLASAGAASPGDTITFSALGGAPGSAVVVLAAAASGATLRLPVAQGVMDSACRFDAQWTVPPGFRGWSLEFQALGTKKAGGPGESNRVAVRFQ